MTNPPQTTRSAARRRTPRNPTTRARPGRRAATARPQAASPGRQSTGVVLLEVILAVALFASAAAVVGMALKSALDAANRMRLETQALNLAQSVLGDIAVGRIEMVDTPETPYDEDDPRWTYEIITESLTDASNLKRVTVVVRCTDRPWLKPAELTQLMLVTDRAGPSTEELIP